MTERETKAQKVLTNWGILKKNACSWSWKWDMKKDYWVRLKVLSDSPPSGTCTTLRVKKIVTFEMSKNGRFDISAMQGAKAHIGCAPWSPNPLASPVLTISPSITESRLIQFPPVALFDFSAAAEPVFFQYWIPKTMGPSKQKMCSEHCPALARGDSRTLLCERLSAGAQDGRGWGLKMGWKHIYLFSLIERLHYTRSTVERAVHIKMASVRGKKRDSVTFEP